jgi:hypothetical protein
MSNSKILSVFDFDDTLAKCDCLIYVMRDGEVVNKLTPSQYAIYELQEGEDFSYEEFNKLIKNPIIIKENFRLLVKQLDKARRSARGSRKVTILTARGLSLPVTDFFKKLGLKPYVVALCSADPMDKANWIEEQINKGYTTIYFMDDSEKNINAVNEMLKKYPDVISEVALIK